MANVFFYLASSLEKIFPDQRGPELSDLKEQKRVESVSILRGELPAFQLVYGKRRQRNTDREEDLSNNSDEALSNGFFYEITGSPVPVRVRDVELVPSAFPCYEKTDEWYLTNQPGLFPDLLCQRDSNFVRFIPGQTRALWIDFPETAQIPAGSYPISISIYGEKESDELKVESGSKKRVCYQTLTFILNVLAVALPQQTLIHTEWFHTDCLADYYHVPVFSEAHWNAIEKQIALAGEELGINMLLTPVFTPPLDTAVGGERTTVQLVKIGCECGKYTFDFSDLARWCEVCHRHGIQYLEIPHLFTQWGAKAAPKIVVTEDGKEMKKFGWHTQALDPAYQEFLRQFLPALQEALNELGYDRKHIYFHISDEPGADCLESYQAARESVKLLLMGWQVVDALSDYSFYEKKIVKEPVVANNHIETFLDHQVPDLWVYYCCAQSIAVPNRFFAMPSWRNRIMGVLMYLYNIKGFLHWGFNFYNSQYSIRHIDPFFNTHADYAFPSGDAFLVYPGTDGKPMSSIRAQVQRQALDDLCALQALEAVIGRERTVALVKEGWDGPFDFMHYPRTADYFLKLRERIRVQFTGHSLD